MGEDFLFIRFRGLYFCLYRILNKKLVVDIRLGK